MRWQILTLLLASGLIACGPAHRGIIGCRSNLKNIGTALEMYSTDFHGHYPRRLADLCPNYISRIPQCPTAQADTYSQSYAYRSNPDNYAFFCMGENHLTQAAGPNRPLFDSVNGLQDKVPQGTLESCKDNLKSLASALASYHDRQHSYPKKLEDLKISLPTCPASQADYLYARKKNSYELYCGDPTAHVTDGIRPFQPALVPGKGLIAEAIPASPLPRAAEPVDATPKMIAICGGFAALLSLLTFGRQRRAE